MTLTLYTARGCCLCDALKDQLEALSGEFRFILRTVDITGDPELEARYRAELPVLLIDGRKAVKYRIETAALREKLRRAQEAECDRPSGEGSSYPGRDSS